MVYLVGGVNRAAGVRCVATQLASAGRCSAFLRLDPVPVHDLARLRNAFVVIRDQHSQRPEDGMILR